MGPSVIAYHGLPIIPDAAAVKVLAGRHAFVSFAHPEQLELAAAVASTFALDNGAFVLWRAGKARAEWRDYYAWVDDASRRPGFDFAIIPDSVEGGEHENDRLITEWESMFNFPQVVGVPVWHLHEGIERLCRLVERYPRVALGSSGQYKQPGSAEWWARVEEFMPQICDADGYPRARLHGLRMLSSRLTSVLPLASADSTNIGRNIGIDAHWRGTYQPPDKIWRALVLAARIEAGHTPTKWEM
jgi:hypothetical protein